MPSCPSYTLTQALTNSLVMRFSGSSFIMVVLFICFPMHVWLTTTLNHENIITLSLSFSLSITNKKPLNPSITQHPVRKKEGGNYPSIYHKQWETLSESILHGLLTLTSIQTYTTLLLGYYVLVRARPWWSMNECVCVLIMTSICCQVSESLKAGKFMCVWAHAFEI